MKKSILEQNFIGYVNHPDKTKTDPQYLVAPSQNMIIDEDKIVKRKGYELDGPASTDLFPIRASYDWETSTGVERNLRCLDEEIQYRFVASDGTVTYRTLVDGFNDTDSYNFAEWWSTTENIDHLLFVRGTDEINMWSGGVTTIASVGAGTLTKEGTTSWAEERFLLAGTREVVILGVTYAYTGGEGTTTLTGVTPDPAAAAPAISVGDICHQAIRVTPTTPIANFNNDLIAVLDNYVYISSLTRRDVFLSKSSDFTDFTFTTPVRLPNEGALLTLDGNPVGFSPDEGQMYISAKRDDWYQVKFKLSADLTGESVQIVKLKSGAGQGAKAQASIGRIKNAILFMNNDNDLDTLGNVENIPSPETKPLSDLIRNLLDGFDYTIAPHIKYFKRKTYVAIPSESIVLIYDHDLQLWNPPQILPIRRLAIIGDELFGHSNAVSETYKLFTGTSDNGNNISAKAYFAYNNYGRRDWEDNFDEFFIEGYISKNTIITAGLNYNYEGFSGNRTFNISGDDKTIIFESGVDASLGKSSLGKEPHGSTTTASPSVNKFIVKETTRKLAAFEVQRFFEDDETDTQWEILAFGLNAILSTVENITIKH